MKGIRENLKSEDAFSFLIPFILFIPVSISANLAERCHLFGSRGAGLKRVEIVIGRGE